MIGELLTIACLTMLQFPLQAIHIHGEHFHLFRRQCRQKIHAVKPCDQGGFFLRHLTPAYQWIAAARRICLRNSGGERFNAEKISVGNSTANVVMTCIRQLFRYFTAYPTTHIKTKRHGGKETSKALEALASGKIDIVIGTHKLLQDDVHFKQLGLVIIDEEHRFGVRDKEQMKKLRANVDMLTMTATPIPRTLNMSLSGLRDLSIIATPPTQRHAIKTFVCEWNKTIIQEACARELSRGGQVYVLHNEVKTIDKVEQELSAMLPGVTVRHAHGQMRANELENIMSDFYHQRFQILIATTIIESGIDVPTANTILINRADKLGLAQLHQLRGRVGRSHHRAYAYLIAPPKSALTPDAVKRLEAIESLEELGVGFTLATHDLEIRGAGELLGEGQSGQIQEIGFN